ncbi:hypothetical protein [Frigoriglobus tundricola]|uniref:Transmembrane protein n=1 Tax=Frigoriglobus tundricola TaxID=2774151 RepID=A0A6M5YTP0_9BACT|nr:hypothetical protein [Frigoriglobus tundricola]QJW96740.1 hypothetical protein FTUN_4299 [Frigoriglobus tundricola]
MKVKKDSLACLWRWMVDVPFGRPRLTPLLWRWGAVIAITATLFVVFLLDPFEKGSIWPKVLFAISAVYYWFIAYEFFRLENGRLYALYNQRRAWYDGQFQTPPRFAAIAPAAPRPWLDDPAVRKFTAEVLEVGFAHAGDCAAVPIDSAVMVARTFLAPDGVTYLVLSFAYAAGSGATRSCCWPAALGIDCYTFNYANGSFHTLDYETVLMNLKRTVPTMRTLALPRGSHPLDLFRAHTKAIEQWERETGVVPLPHERLDVFIAHLERIRLQEREFYRAHPYSRRDHRRWYLQLDVPRSSESK